MKLRTPKWVDRILLTIMALLAIQLLLATVPMAWGYYPVFGRSMQPTFPWLWGYFKYEEVLPAAIRVNDLIVVRGGVLGYAVKRVANTDPIKGLYLKGDNLDHSMDSSFGADPTNSQNEVWVPFDDVVGRVTSIWSPARAKRSRTAAGLKLNQFEFENKTFPVGCYQIADHGDSIEVLDQRGGISEIKGKYMMHRAGLLFVRRAEDVCIVDPQYPDRPYVDLQLTLMSWYGASASSKNLEIKTKRVPGGLEFTLPDGRALFVRCILR